MTPILAKIGSALLIPFIAISGFFSHTVAPSFGASVPQGPAIFETSLLSAITDSASSMTIVANSVRGGSTLSGFQCFTVDEGRAEREDICGSVSGTAVSSLVRGVDPLTATTTNSALKFAHRRGANVKITDFPLIQILRNQLNGSETIPNPISYVAGTSAGSTTDQLASMKQVVGAANTASTTVDARVTALDLLNAHLAGSEAITGVKTFSGVPIFSNGATVTPAPVNGTDAANKTYVDGVAVAGASNADTTTKGIVEMATNAEAAAGTTSGGTSARLALGANLATSTSQVAQNSVVVTKSTGKIDPTFLNGADAYTMTGLTTTKATSTNATTTYSYVSGTSTIGVLNVTSLGKNVQICTANCTWTKADPTLAKIKVTVIGGGGGGGGTGNATSWGSGAGGGGEGISWIDVTSTSTVNAIVGAAGTGGASGSGTDGGTSRFSSYCIATGGLKGLAPGTSKQGGTGGNASGCDLNLSGSAGGHSGGNQAGNDYSGNGGSSPHGGGGVGYAGGAGCTAGGTYGGGGGGSGNAAGCDGGGGAIIIEW